MVEAIGNYGIPTASQLKLNIRRFDGTKPYEGLGSGFIDGGGTFMRAVSSAEISGVFLLDGGREGRPFRPSLKRYYGALLSQAGRHLARLEHVM